MIIICPEQSIQTFEVTPTLDSKTDKEFSLIKKNLTTLTEAVQVFDLNLLDFMRAMSVFAMGKVSLQSAMLLLMVLLKPYTAELSAKRPYIILKPELKDEVPQNLMSLYFKWELLVCDISEVEFVIEVVTNNLHVLIEKHLRHPSRVTKGLKLNVVGLKTAENKMRLINVREKFKAVTAGFEALTEAIKKSVDSFYDERHRTIARITQILRLANAKDQFDAANLFGRIRYFS